MPRPKRRFGQNFLTNQAYAKRIVDLASLDSEDTVLEIGPGRGVITSILADKGCRLFALEIDRDLFEYLSAIYSGVDNVSILNEDALRFDFGTLSAVADRRVKVIANLPYNVATPILFRLFEFREIIDTMVLMFQREVADRITASPGGRKYGALSIFPQLYADIDCALRLPAGAFYPAPRVQSAVLVFDILYSPRFDVRDERILKELIKAAFSKRRKKVVNSLRQLMPESAMLMNLLSIAGIDPSKRPEMVSVEEFCRLSNLISELGD